MKVLSVSKDGSSAAIPEIFIPERCYAIFHGAAESSGEGVQSFQYCLRLGLGRENFPLKRGLWRDCWSMMEYSLSLEHFNNRDDLGNAIYVLNRPKTPAEDGVCICLLDMYEGAVNSTAILHSCNKQVRELGEGIQERPVRLKGGGAKRLVENKYPALLCESGAKFQWTVGGFSSANHEDYQAEWDGVNFHVARQALAVTDLMEQYHLAEQSERREALRRNV